MLDLLEPVFASFCSLKLSAPSLMSVFSHPLAAATAGEQFVIATTITTCIEEEQAFVAIIEVRNSDGITEYLGWQSGILREKNDSTQIGLSWVPRHGGNYELRTFAISGFENPLILSAVMTTNLSIADSTGKAVIVIPYNPEPALQQVGFDPSLLKVVLGVNSTVVWTNGDNVSHSLIGDPSSPNPFDFDGEHVFLYPGYSFQHVFTEADSFHYLDRDRDWMRGIVWVIPHDAVNAYLIFTVNGLQDTYHLDQNETIEFSVDVNGFETGCGVFDFLVERIDEGGAEHPFGYQGSAVFDCFNVAAPYRDVSLHFPWSEEGPLYQIPINQTGTYRLTTSFDTDYTSIHYSRSKEFLVIH